MPEVPTQDDLDDVRSRVAELGAAVEGIQEQLGRLVNPPEELAQITVTTSRASLQALLEALENRWFVADGSPASEARRVIRNALALPA